jgi:hypothetical protein
VTLTGLRHFARTLPAASGGIVVLAMFVLWWQLDIGQSPSLSLLGSCPAGGCRGKYLFTYAWPASVVPTNSALFDRRWSFRSYG